MTHHDLPSHLAPPAAEPDSGGPPPRWSRRHFLAASGAVSAAAAAGSGLRHASPAHAATPAADESPAPFAMITDTHINPDHPDRSARLELVLGHLRSRNPAFVLHCGDITDTGSSVESDLYASLVPDGLRGRMHHIPGNHESMWNVDAFEDFRRRYGGTRTAFTAGGYRMIGLDPVISLQANGQYFGQPVLDWFEQALQESPTGTPILCFVHFPMGGKWHYVTDGDAFLRLATRYGVRGIFCGHRHKLGVDTFNGITQVSGRAIRGVAAYYWAQPGPAGLDVTEVVVAEDGSATETAVATMALQPGGAGSDLGPLHPRARADGANASVTLRPPAGVAGAMAQLFPQGGTVAGWQPLVKSGRLWTGTVPIADLPPGRHRIEVRTVGDGAVYDDNVALTIPERAVRVAWTYRMPGRIRAELAEHDGLVVVGSIGGAVAALRPTARSARPQWRADVGPVYKRAVFGPGAEIVVVPSADHHLYGLDVADGAVRWRRDLGAPVLCDPVLVPVADERRIVVTVGRTVHCLTPDGETVWQQELGGVFVGQVACDGARVYIGSGDGRVRALDAQTGRELWATLVVDRESLYHSLAYGPWAAHLRLLPGNAVLTGVFTNLVSLDRDTGTVRWSTPDTNRQVIYTPPTVTEHGILWFDGKDGTAHLTDPETGAQLWSAPAFPSTRDTAPVQVGSDTWWMVGSPGTAARIDLSRRTIEHELQISHEFAFTTPTVVGRPGHRVLVSGAQDGGVRGIVGMPE